MPGCRPSFLDGANLRMLLFGGKGGVGKTTCAAAAALHMARQLPQKTFLLASLDPAHSLTDSLGAGFLPENLRYLELDFRASLEQFKLEHAAQIRQIALRGTFLDEEDVGQMLELSIPGFDELMAFTEIAHLLEGQSYSCIILDTAPTGHTLRFLELPELMRSWLEALDAMLAKHRYLVEVYRHNYEPDDTDRFLENLTASIEGLASLLADTNRCRFIPVMLAEPLSTYETRRLVDKLEERKVAVREIVVNRLYPVQENCTTCQAARQRQLEELRRVAAEFDRYTLWAIPLQGGEVRGSAMLARFWDEAVPLDGPPEPVVDADPGSPKVHLPAQLPGGGIGLVLFAGKGGVGKTTLACASAARLAQEYPDREVLLFSTDPAHSLADCLAVEVGPRETSLAPGLTAMEVNAEAEFAKLKQFYADEVEKFFGALLDDADVDVEFDREVIERILDLSPPGLDEVMALLRAMELMESGKYQVLVLDTAPTGHLIRLLELPELIQNWLKAIFDLFLKYKKVFRLPRIRDFLVGVSRKLKALRGMLGNPAQGQLYVVSILTEMAYAETEDLHQACRRAGVYVPAFFLNLATPARDCSLCQGMVETETRIRNRFAQSFPEVPQTIVYRWAEVRGLDRLTTLGQALYRN